MIVLNFRVTFTPTLCHVDTRIYTCIQVYRYTVIQVYRYKGIQVYRYTGIQVYRYRVDCIYI